MSHQDRREPLPDGYQFGDARPADEYDMGGGVPSWAIVDGRLVRLPRVYRPPLYLPDLRVRDRETPEGSEYGYRLDMAIKTLQQSAKSQRTGDDTI